MQEADEAAYVYLAMLITHTGLLPVAHILPVPFIMCRGAHRALRAQSASWQMSDRTSLYKMAELSSTAAVPKRSLEIAQTVNSHLQILAAAGMCKGPGCNFCVLR